MTERYGLSPDSLAEIIAILSACTAVESIVLFGSRAAGTFKPGSDVDLALRGQNLTFDDVLSLKTALDETTLPYAFDLVWDHGGLNADLRHSVATTGVGVYKKATLTF
jgi:predicted nucleotidyltransferase